MAMMMSKNLEYYLNLPYSIVLTPGTDDDDGWLAEIPDLPGCFTAGDTKEEALELIEDAKRLWITHRFEEGYPIPEPQKVR
jgi:antitoxin HicB